MDIKEYYKPKFEDITKEVYQADIVKGETPEYKCYSIDYTGKYLGIIAWDLDNMQYVYLPDRDIKLPYVVLKSICEFINDLMYERRLN